MMMSIDSIGGAMERVPNLNAEIVQQIADKLGMKFTPEKHPSNPEKLPSGGGDEMQQCINPAGIERL
jgi:hypothetical protein